MHLRWLRDRCRAAYALAMIGQVFGREPEQRAIAECLDGLRHSAGGMVLAGPPGVGKTTLLRDAVRLAADRGYLVLSTTPAQGDLRLAFAGVADLLEAHVAAVAASLPPPQARALRIALLEEEAGDLPPEPRLIAAAFRSALRYLSLPAPVLLAVDDVQWLDPPSVTTVGFALRRLDSEPVGLICAQRTEPAAAGVPLDLDRARFRPQVLTLGGLSTGALHRILRTQLGSSFSRPALRRIAAESGGNPFIALEIGRALARDGAGAVRATALPVPATLHGLTTHRLGQLAPDVRSALSLVAVMPAERLDTYVRGGVSESCLQAAVDAGVLEHAEDRIRFSHPVLRSVVVAALPAARLRAMHGVAAGLAVSEEDQARHQALAADGPSDAIARRLDAAAQSAIRRGAPATAGELLELAVSLTPPADQLGKGARAAKAGANYTAGGEPSAATALLERCLAELAPGPARADVLIQLSREFVDSDGAHARALLEEALTEVADDSERTAEAYLALGEVLARSGETDGALASVEEGLARARRTASPALVARAITSLSLLQLLFGRQPDALLVAEAMRIEQEIGIGQFIWDGSAVYTGGYAALIDGRLAEAEACWRRLFEFCEAENVEYWLPDLLMRRALTAMCGGDLRSAASLAAEGLELAEQLGNQHNVAALAWACAEVAAQRGHTNAAADLARRGLREAESITNPAFRMRCEAVLGELALARGDYREAAQTLGPLAVRWRAEAGRLLLPFGIEVSAVDALVRAGEVAPAERLITDMAASAHGPLGAAIMARCHGQLAAARGDLDKASTELRQALVLHDQISPQPIARGHVLLLLGQVLLRRKDRKAARETLLAAIESFGQAGAALWIPRVQAELARISGRAPVETDLTATERRVADLVASGRTNKEAAAELFVSVRAIESTLTKAYAKLGVRSRTELAARLRAGGQP
jgi:DNA-binding CsgD family transcriptional regulator